MTTVQTMHIRLGAFAPVVLALAVALLSGACAKKGVLEPPEVLVAPYETSRGEVLWAVAPLANESGTSVADTVKIADDLVAKIGEVRGIACLPLNRTLAAMRARGLKSIQSPQDARALANALGVDALVVGSVTAYDPYSPPKIGLSLALFAREGAAGPGVDPMKLKSAYTDYDQQTRAQFLERPTAVVSMHLDGANHEVQMDIQRYATGRHDRESALGWRGILSSMDLYTQYAAHAAVSRLLDKESIRVGQPAPDAKQAAQAP